MSRLVRVTATAQPDGRWRLLREHDGEGGGDSWTCDDLLDCWETVDAAYRPDGTPRLAASEAP